MTSKDPDGFENHAYEFLTDGTCIERFRNVDQGGPINEPPRYIQMDWVITYTFKPQGNEKYRLQEIKALANGRPNGFAPTWHILNVSITGDRAIVYVVEREEDHGFGAKAMDDLMKQSGSAPKEKPDATQRERVTWKKLS